MAGLLRLAGLAVLFYFAYRIISIAFNIVALFLRVKSSAPFPGGKSGPGWNPGGVAEMVRDPMCGSYVSVGHALMGTFQGQRYFFCSQKCMDDFRAKLGA